jgi:hypothetical protein
MLSTMALTWLRTGSPFGDPCGDFTVYAGDSMNHAEKTRTGSLLSRRPLTGAPWRGANHVFALP